MMLAETENFKDAKKVKYATAADFTLSGDNGKKTVYVKFYSPSGLDLGVVADSIMLEKAAEEIKKSEPKPAAQPGDFTADGKVDILDFNLLMVEWNKVKSLADFNQDGAVNIADLNELMIVWPGN
jgi:hypothetical protein